MVVCLAPVTVSYTHLDVYKRQVKDPSFVKEAVKKYGERIAVGIDAKNGMVAAEGWLSTSDVHLSLIHI